MDEGGWREDIWEKGEDDGNVAETAQEKKAWHQVFPVWGLIKVRSWKGHPSKKRARPGGRGEIGQEEGDPTAFSFLVNYIGKDKNQLGRKQFETLPKQRRGKQAFEQGTYFCTF